jgi:hypothetical protein
MALFNESAAERCERVDDTLDRDHAPGFPDLSFPAIRRARKFRTDSRADALFVDAFSALGRAEELPAGELDEAVLDDVIGAL